MPRYDPEKHHRRSIRLPGFDYTQPGAYFVTIVTAGRELLFGDIMEGRVQLSLFGRVANALWQDIPSHFKNVELDEWIVMPNHHHGLFWIIEWDEATGERVRRFADLDGFERMPNRGQKGALPGSVAAIVGTFQSITTRRINRIRQSAGEPVWQRNFYESIIRDEQHLAAIRQYIRDNPNNWPHDPDNPKCDR